MRRPATHQTSRAAKRSPVAAAGTTPRVVALAGVLLGMVLLGEALARAVGVRAAPGAALGVGAALALLGGVGGVALVWMVRMVRMVRRRTAAWTAPARGVAWEALTPAGFEREVARLFARAGYQVKLVGAVGDGGVDVRVWAPGRAGMGAGAGIVQCKRYAAGCAVGPATVRELIGARTHERAPAAWLATTGRPTLGARRLAAAERIVVLDTSALAAWDARLG
ncbi:MAG TPA: restriction endonuclease [Ktedonobacterales bacterium]|jgi:hypothetical protein